jgi:hypothetical protein
VWVSSPASGGPGEGSCRQPTACHPRVCPIRQPGDIPVGRTLRPTWPSTAASTWRARWSRPAAASSSRPSATSRGGGRQRRMPRGFTRLAILSWTLLDHDLPGCHHTGAEGQSATEAGPSALPGASVVAHDPAGTPVDHRHHPRWERTHGVRRQRATQAATTPSNRPAATGFAGPGCGADPAVSAAWDRWRGVVVARQDRPIQPACRRLGTAIVRRWTVCSDRCR